jgi:hypothetical protein
MRGVPLDLTGTLLRDGRRLLLAVSGGGEWIVDPPLFANGRRLIGKRVRVVGVRGGFNLVDAHRLEAS